MWKCFSHTPDEVTKFKKILSTEYRFEQFSVLKSLLEQICVKDWSKRLTKLFCYYCAFYLYNIYKFCRIHFEINNIQFFSFLIFYDYVSVVGRYVGSRPIKLRKSTWRNRCIDVVKKKEKEKAALLNLLTSGNR